MDMNLYYSIIIFTATVFLAIIAYCCIMFLYYFVKFMKDMRVSRSFDLIGSSDLLAPEISIMLKGHDSIEEYIESSGGREAFVRSPEYKRILDFINRLEVLSIGVRNGFYSEDIIFEYVGTSFVRYYRSFQSYIDVSRETTNNRKLYINFEAIARRWEGGVV